jgi:predicted SnoaL-like aldol condensation-catalyzing enzyme
MNISTEEKNKALVVEAFEAAFNRRDPAAFDRYWSPKYLQHSAHIPPGRDGLRSLIAAVPKTFKYEHGPVTASGEYVMLHGRFTGLGFQERAWIVVDIVRVVDGVLVEHWDVIQDEATRSESKSGLPMFGESFTS